MKVPDVENLLNNLNIKYSDLTLLKRKHNFFQSFSFAVNIKDKENILNPNIWPEGIIVNRLIKPKNENNHNTNESTNNNNNKNKSNN